MYKLTLFLFAIGFMIACSSDSDNSPSPTNSNPIVDDDGIIDQQIKGDVDGIPWSPDKAFVRKDTNFAGSYVYRLWIYNSANVPDFSSPCFDDRYWVYDSVGFRANGEIPLELGTHAIGDDGEFLDFNSQAYGSYSGWTGIYKVYEIDEENNILELGMKAEGFGGVINGKIECEICPDREEYEFKNQELAFSFEGESMDLEAGRVALGAFNLIQFTLSFETVISPCNVGVTTAPIVFSLPSLDENVYLLDQSSGYGSTSGLVVDYFDRSVIPNLNIRARWGAIEIVEQDTANDLVRVRIDAKGEKGLNINGEYSFTYCN